MQSGHLAENEQWNQLMPSPGLVAQEMLDRREARRDLLKFAEYITPGWITGEHHRKICDHLMAVERGEINRLMIFAPPRHSKSELASRLFPAWYFGRHPERQLICASYGSDLVTDFGHDVRSRISDDYYARLFPETKLVTDAKAAGRMRLTKGGIYVAASVGGEINGRGAHVLLIDDPVKGRSDVESPRKRDLAWKWFTGSASQRLMKGGAIVMMLTRWHEDDLAARALQTEEWTVLKLQAIENEGTDDEKALWPDMFSLKYLQQRREFYSRAAQMQDWRAQYQQEPSSEEGEFIRRDWFRIRYDTAPENMNIYIASDYAVSEAGAGMDPDWTEHGVFGVAPDKKIYVLDWWSGRTPSDIWCHKLVDLIEKWKPRAIFEEKGVILKAVDPILKRIMKDRGVGVRREPLPSVSGKVARGRSFQGMAAMGRFVFPTVPWAEDVIEQCVSVPGGKHDDKYDVLSLLCRGLDKMSDAVVRTEHRRIQERNWKVL